MLKTFTKEFCYSVFRKIWSNVPVSKPYPIKTFFSRTRRKIRNIQWRHKRLAFFRKAYIFSENKFISVLSLKSNSIIGQKNDLIYLPNDSYIKNFVCLTGSWSDETSNFLARFSNYNSWLIDIGAHAGLIGKQIHKMNGIKNIVAVEPRKSNFFCLKKNLQKLRLNNLHLYNYALGSDKNARLKKLYIERVSSMNAGIYPELPGSPQDILIEKVKFLQTSKFIQELSKLVQANKLVLKIDTQGNEIEILKDFPQSIWDLVDAAAIEITSNLYNNIEDINIFESKLPKTFLFFLDSDIKSSISMYELRDFYLSKSQKTINLFCINNR